jgi:hypothetical protein
LISAALAIPDISAAAATTITNFTTILRYK